MGKVNVYDTIVIENMTRKEKIWKSKKVYIRLHLKDCSAIVGYLQFAKASRCQMKRWHHLPHATHIAILWVSYSDSYWRHKSRSCTEYL